MKKRSEETQTLRAGCSKAEPKNFRLAADPLPGGAGRPKLNQFGEERCTQFRVIVVTDPPTHPQTQPQTSPTTIHCAAAS